MAPLQPTSSVDTNSVMEVEMEENKGIENPATHDVLCGRGGNINTHTGNENFRKLIEIHKRSYLTARFKKDKRLITDTIIKTISDRGGRFLSRESKSGLWFQVTEEKARDKTSQALRENAPKLREAIEKENEDIRRAREKEEEEIRKNEAYHRHYGTPQKHPHSVDPYNSHDSRFRGPSQQDHQNYQGYSDRTYYPNRWTPSPDRPTPQRDQRMNEPTPRYNNTKSMVETFAEAFACPTSLDDVYSKTQKFFPPHSPAPSSQVQSDSSTQYSGQKRNYQQPRERGYQHRDDREHWNGKYHPSQDYQSSDVHSKRPVYYKLPSDQNHTRVTSPPGLGEQRNPKRVKGSHDGFDSFSYDSYKQPQSATHSLQSRHEPPSSSSSTTSWNPFVPWNKTAPSPIHRRSTPLEEGQEVQLITRVGSMTMDDQVVETAHCSHPYLHRPHAEKEVRTPPPPDDENVNVNVKVEAASSEAEYTMKVDPAPVAQDTKKQTSNNYDWTSMGNCNAFFFTDILGLNNNDKKPDNGLKISPVPSFDFNGSIGSLEGNEMHSGGDLNGASLVNVFSDGENNAVNLLEKPVKGNRQSSSDQSKSSIFNISDLGNDIDVLSY